MIEVLRGNEGSLVRSFSFPPSFPSSFSPLLSLFSPFFPPFPPFFPSFPPTSLSASDCIAVCQSESLALPVDLPITRVLEGESSKEYRK